MEKRSAFIHVYTPNPELLKGIPSDRIASANKIDDQANLMFKQCISTEKI